MYSVLCTTRYSDRALNQLHRHHDLPHGGLQNVAHHYGCVAWFIIALSLSLSIHIIYIYIHMRCFTCCLHIHSLAHIQTFSYCTILLWSVVTYWDTAGGASSLQYKTYNWVLVSSFRSVWRAEALWFAGACWAAAAPHPMVVMSVSACAISHSWHWTGSSYEIDTEHVAQTSYAYWLKGALSVPLTWPKGAPWPPPPHHFAASASVPGSPFFVPGFGLSFAQIWKGPLRWASCAGRFGSPTLKPTAASAFVGALAVEVRWCTGVSVHRYLMCSYMQVQMAHEWVGGFDGIHIDRNLRYK